VVREAPAAQDAASGHASTGPAGSGKCSGQCMPARRGMVVHLADTGYSGN